MLGASPPSPLAIPRAMLTVGIDTGGTFTDVFLSADEEQAATVKAAPTTSTT